MILIKQLIVKINIGTLIVVSVLSCNLLLFSHPNMLQFCVRPPLTYHIVTIPSRTEIKIL
jgi:hypothetical protein